MNRNGVLTRRRMLRGAGRAAATALFGMAGYKVGTEVGGKVAGGFAKGLEGTLNEFYGVTHDILAEVHGTAEKKLASEAAEVRAYIGTLSSEYDKRANYWEKAGVVGKKEITDLQHILDNVDRYTAEADLPERLTRLKDRLMLRATKAAEATIKVDDAIEKKYPAGVRSFNKWFTDALRGPGEERKVALHTYKEKLDTLVKVYDTNQDNRIAQADLLDETGGFFSVAQKDVLSRIDGYLGKGIADPEEKAFYEGLKEMGNKDPSGKAMADYLLNTHSYFQSLEANNQLTDMTSRLGSTILQLKDLQGKMDEGITLKNQIRTAQTEDLKRLQTKADELYTWMDHKKEELAKEGYSVNYELYPRLKALRDKVFSGIDEVRDDITLGVGAIGAAVGAIGGAYASGKAPWGTKYSRRELMMLDRLDSETKLNDYTIREKQRLEQENKKLKDDVRILENYLPGNREEDL